MPKDKVEWKLIKATDVDADAQTMLGKVLAEDHTELIGKKIIALFRPESWSTQGTTGVVGTAKKVSVREKLLSSVDAVVILAWDWWQEAEEEPRTALLDHELSHLSVDDDGNLITVPHDFSGFARVIGRHGIWNSSLEKAQRAIQPRLLDVKPDPDAAEQAAREIKNAVSDFAQSVEDSEGIDSVKISSAEGSVTIGGK